MVKLYLATGQGSNQHRITACCDSHKLVLVLQFIFFKCSAKKQNNNDNKNPILNFQSTVP